MIRITSKRDGFRRCGMAHSAVPTEWADGYWSDEQLAILQAEPMLIVERLTTSPSDKTTNSKPRRRQS